MSVRTYLKNIGTRGFLIERNVIQDKRALETVSRLFMQDIWERGLSREDLWHWKDNACPFPHLRFAEPVVQLADAIKAELGLADEDLGPFCEPQFIFHWPQDNQWNLPPAHLDTPPPWAEPGQGYQFILGLALNEWDGHNGSLRIWKPRPTSIELAPGDLVMMHPNQEHASGVNHSADVRRGIYFRWLEPYAE